MQPVHILGWRYCFAYADLVDMGGQGKLHQDAMHRRIGIQKRHGFQKLDLGNRAGQPYVVGRDPKRGAGLVLSVDVRLACGVVANQNGGQPRRHPARDKRPGPVCQFLEPLTGQGVAVKKDGGHAP